MKLRFNQNLKAAFCESVSVSVTWLRTLITSKSRPWTCPKVSFSSHQNHPSIKRLSPTETENLSSPDILFGRKIVAKWGRLQQTRINVIGNGIFVSCSIIKSCVRVNGRVCMNFILPRLFPYLPAHKLLWYFLFSLSSVSVNIYRIWRRRKLFEFNVCTLWNT